MPEWLYEEWALALSHAELDSSILLFELRGAGPNALNALHFPPRMVAPAEQIPDEDDRARINADRERHRVVLWPDGKSRPVVGALLRHELEHVRQWDRLGVRHDMLYDIALDLLRLKAGGLDGCAGWLINTIPAEEDCNDAAAIYLREHHADAVADMCRGDFRHLACSLVGPQPIETLPARTVAWMFVHSDLCAQRVEGTGWSFGEILSSADARDRELWGAIEAAAGRLAE
jgi:hypothetical protein